jgi:hypothetical protein
MTDEKNQDSEDSENRDNLVQSKPLRDERGQLLPGGPSNNPAGRPKGQTMKEFAREFLMKMDEKQKRKWLRKNSKDLVWRMAEGNPHQTTDVTSGGKPIPIFGGVAAKDNGPIQEHNGDKENLQSKE